MPLRIYYYYFYGIKKPLTIEACDKKAAREILLSAVIPDEYKDKPIISETTSSLLAGISQKMHKGEKMTWNGSSWQKADTYINPSAE